MPTHRSTTEVAIVGGGPAGLMLSHLLHRAGIDTTVVDGRAEDEILGTARAGMLEPDNVRLLADSGVSDRVLREGHRHDGMALRFDAADHRIDFTELAGASTWLYPQTAVFEDLVAARRRDNGDVRFAVRDTRLHDPTE